ncbi:hypothetical protein AYO21_10174 [Fonsecaea monophora]|uniref:Uncharacterized protein n=1 Tax=Fonsecaea monophora TaxID=254056 RepID=A0A177EUD3_9EURO|nr:hypothetical protein AYO21_10174 [Fonsecaea monophora]KAH0829866.1 hypothetical protein FOPE_10820 [Fonsecaea pedrosoi]OAG35634.1 hypothetical protein AYO21_10174 [Fonsecaea monophora]
MGEVTVVIMVMGLKWGKCALRVFREASRILNRPPSTSWEQPVPGSGSVHDLRSDFDTRCGEGLREPPIVHPRWTCGVLFSTEYLLVSRYKRHQPIIFYSTCCGTKPSSQLSASIWKRSFGRAVDLIEVAVLPKDDGADETLGAGGGEPTELLGEDV